MMIKLLVFILGVIIGSFLNVVIYRLPKEKDMILSRSHCTKCGQILSPIDLIPILSFLFNLGKCRYCSEKISVQYPIVELLSGLILITLYLQFSFSYQFWIYSYLSLLLIVCSVIDFNHYIIPNKITYPNLILGLLLSLFLPHISFTSSLIGALAPTIFLLIIAFIYRGGMGMGDVKFMAMIGSFIGAKYAILGIFLASFIGSIIALVVLLITDKGLKYKIPFGPFLTIGSLMMIILGEKIIELYLNLFSLV